MENSNISSNYYRQNTPNATKFVNSLRNTGYNNVSAIADLVDNAIDARADKIWFTMEPTKNDQMIIIADNGSGMSEETLDEAMRLGSDTERNENSDLGKFGMGLVTASISIGKRLTVITRQAGKTWVAVQDLDEVMERGEFVKQLYLANEEENVFFDKQTKRATHGTVVIIEKCDRLQNGNINEMCAQAAKHLGQTFRMFLSTRKIFVRGTEIEPVDPLFLDHEDTKEFSDETFEVDVNGTKENVRVRIVAVPDFGQQGSKRAGVNQKNQGFYLMRNNREIATGEDLGIFTKHNSLNRLRIEVFFSAHLDDEMGVNFTKRDIKPKKNIVDKLHEITYPQISSFGKRVKRERATENSEEVDHGAAAKNITAKSNILIRPNTNFTLRSKVEEAVKEAQAGELEQKGGITEKMNCEFLYRDNGPGGLLFEAEQVGKKTIIYYNISHPFYQDFIAVNKDDKEIVNVIDYLIYSLASAQLFSQNDENAAIFDNFNSVFASNLRTLIS